MWMSQVLNQPKGYKSFNNMCKYLISFCHWLKEIYFYFIMMRLDISTYIQGQSSLIAVQIYMNCMNFAVVGVKQLIPSMV